MILFSGKSDPGRVRKVNEDYCHAGSKFLAVADGLGGHNAGEIASKMAIEIFREGLKKIDPEIIDDRLINLIEKANREVFKKATSEQVYGGMGTTLTAAVPLGSTLHLIHIGDSRAYLLRDGTLTQLTTDHSLVADMVKAGRLTADEAKVHPQRSVITRALGTESEVEADLIREEIENGDRLLLCTDGLSSLVDDETIKKILTGEPLSAVADKLIAAANELGGYDNITVVVSEFNSIKKSKTPQRIEKDLSCTALKPRANQWKILLPLLVVIALLIALAASAALSSFQNVEMKLEGSRVTVYEGSPGRTFLGIPLYKVIERRTVNPGSIEPYLKERLLDGASYRSLNEARDQLSKLPGGVDR